MKYYMVYVDICIGDILNNGSSDISRDTGIMKGEEA